MSEQKIDSEFIEEVKQILPADELEDFLSACQVPLKKSITLNTNKMSVEEFIEITEKRGWKLTPHSFHPNSTSFYIDREDTTTALGNTFLHQCGFFYIQEIAASIPALLVDAKPGESVLDMAAAPGGKASQLTQQQLATKQPGMVIANDVNGKRIPALAHNLNKGGCYNTAVTQFNGFSFGKNLTNFFDHVLVDAPCSGEGTGYKSDFAMKYWNKAEINKIAGTQFQLLISAIKATKPGCTVIYSTCTINPYENEGILARIEAFFGDSISIEPVAITNAAPGVAHEEEEGTFTAQDKVVRFWPHRQETGGFFASKIKKLTATDKQIEKKHKLLPKNQFKLDSSKGLQNKVQSWLKEYFGIAVDPERHYFVATKKVIYMTSPKIQEILPALNLEKVGIPVLKIDRDQYRPSHYLGNMLGDQASKNTINLTTEQMQAYVNNEELTTEDVGYEHDPKTFPYKIIKRDGHGMSVTKVIGTELKYKLFK